MHVSCDAPTHPLPPFLGSGLVQVLIRVPPPQVLEHALKGEKPPCTGTDTNETVTALMNTVTITRDGSPKEWANSRLGDAYCRRNHYFHQANNQEQLHNTLTHYEANNAKTSGRLDTAFRTCTGFRVACFLRCAYTSPAAISRLRVGASSDPSPATTRFRACAEGRKASMHRN